MFHPPENSYIVSITDPGTLDAISPEGYRWTDVCRLRFWDLNEVVYDDKNQPRLPASRMDIQLIWEFIQRNRDKNIFVHCEAGISRSAAVREYLLRRGWELYDAAQERRLVFPNIHILTKLERLDR